MKKYATLFLSLALSLGLQAQEIRPLQHIFLPGGNMIRASILDTTDRHTLVLELSAGDIMEVPFAMVEKIRRGQEGSLYNAGGRSALSTGMAYQISFSTLSARSFHNNFGNDIRTYPSLQFSANYHLLPYLTVGMGTGIEYYDEWIMPVFAQGRIYLPDAVTAPYFNLQLGYGIATQRLFDREEFDQSRGGLMWYPSIGLRMATRRRASLMLDLGYKFQHYTYEYDYPDDWWTTYERESVVYRSFAIRFGVMF